MIKMIVIEDMEILRDSLTGMLSAQPDIEVCATSANANEALSLCQKYNPDLALLDVCTENGASGIKAAFEIRNIFSRLKNCCFHRNAGPFFYK